VDCRYDFRLRDVQEIVIALEIRRMVFEAAPVGSLVQLQRLDHRTHRAIQNYDAGSQELLDHFH
jgi:hypothetical protein